MYQFTKKSKLALSYLKPPPEDGAPLKNPSTSPGMLIGRYGCETWTLYVIG